MTKRPKPIRINRSWGLRGPLEHQARVAKEAARLGYTRRDGAKVRELERQMRKGN